MAYRFGFNSEARLETCHEQLITVVRQTMKWQIMDFSVICGFREEQAQTQAFQSGLSKTEWPNSKHNTYPSIAIDLAPYPIDWNDSLAFARLAGIMGAAAESHGILLRWGGDWDSDGESNDQSFMDIGHFELVV